MPNPLGMEKIMRLIPSIPIGTKLYLRKGAVPGARLREFRFKGPGEKGRVLLAPEPATYEWEAKIENIDWERYLAENPPAAQ
jgi:hypothetical protein